MTLITGERPFYFFLQALGGALSAEHVSVSLGAHVYLARVLQEHLSPHWHPSDTLGDRVAKALGGGLAPAERHQTLREVGDMALIFSGLYHYHGLWSGRGTQATYHIQLGHAAYRHLHQKPYQEIAENFQGLVNTLVRLDAECSLTTDGGLMRLYTIWCKTHDEHLARILTEKGIQVGSAQSKTPS